MAEANPLPLDCKRASALRRVPADRPVAWIAGLGHEGDVGVFQLADSAPPLTMEDGWGRTMAVMPGDVFLATPGHRESTRSITGRVPDDGLVPGQAYWVLADCGAVGELLGASPAEFGHLGKVTFLGTACDQAGEVLSIGAFAEDIVANDDWGAPVFLILGTSAEVGKTTAALTLLRSLLRQGQRRIVALKATGTSLFSEIASFRDFGAASAFDCVDFGLPTTYPSGRVDAGAIFERVIRRVLSDAADAVVIECGGDILGANVPEFLAKLRHVRETVKVVLVAPDALAALGARAVLGDIGWKIDLISGPCTDTPILRTRTEMLCGIPAKNMFRGQSGAVLP